MPRVYITYRLNDTTADEVQQLVAQIGAAFGDENVQLTAADSHVDVLRLYDMVQSYDALLVVIGQRWLAMQNEHGERLIDDPFDYAYTEIFAALEKPDMWVSNLLTDGAKMPQWGDLPEAVNQLARRDIVDLSNKQRLTEKIDELIRRMGTIDVHVPEVIIEEPPQPLPVRRSSHTQPQFEDQIRASDETQQMVGCVSNFVMAIFTLVGLTAVLVVVFGLLFSDSGTSDSVSINAARLTHRAPATFEMQTLSGWNRTQIAATVNSGRRTAQARSHEVNTQEAGRTSTRMAQEFSETIATLTVVIDATRTSLAEMRTHVVETEAGYVADVTEMAETRTARRQETPQPVTEIPNREQTRTPVVTSTPRASAIPSTPLVPRATDIARLIELPQLNETSLFTLEVQHRLEGGERALPEMVFHPITESLLVVAVDNKITRYVITEDAIEVSHEWQLDTPVRTIAYDYLGNYLVAATKDNRLVLLTEDGSVTPFADIGVNFTEIAFVPQSDIVMIVPDNAAPVFYSAATLQSAANPGFDVIPGAVRGFDFHPDGERLAVGYRDSEFVYDGRTLNEGYGGATVNAIDFSNDGEQFLGAKWDNLYIWSSQDGETMMTVYASPYSLVQAQWLPQHDSVIMVAVAGAVYLVDMEQLAVHDVYQIAIGRPFRTIYQTALSPFGNWLAVSDTRGGITLLSLDSN